VKENFSIVHMRGDMAAGKNGGRGKRRAMATHGGHSLNAAGVLSERCRQVGPTQFEDFSNIHKLLKLCNSNWMPSRVPKISKLCMWLPLNIKTALSIGTISNS
jgi:hypothetical protein